MRVMRVMSVELQVSIKLQVTSFYTSFYMKGASWELRVKPSTSI